MNFVKVENGVVVQSDRTGKPPKDFVNAGENVVPGFLFDGEKFAAPPARTKARAPSPLKVLRAEFDALRAALKEKGVI